MVSFSFCLLAIAPDNKTNGRWLGSKDGAQVKALHRAEMYAFPFSFDLVLGTGSAAQK